MKIALFGGSFDPIHWGHIKLLEKMDGSYQFDKIIVIPSKRPPHKPPYFANAERRLKMLEIAFSDSPLKGKIEISDFELKSSDISYSIFTIKYFKKLYPSAEFSFLIGDDAFYGIQDWFAFPEVLHLTNWIVASRSDLEEKRQGVIEELLDEKTISRTSTENVYKTKGGTLVTFNELTLPDVSSTTIRLRLNMDVSIQGLLPDALIEYLNSERVYANN